MFEALDLLPPETDVEPVAEPLVSTAVSAWEELLADTHFILTAANPAQDGTTQDVADQVGTAVEADPTRSIVIAKAWPAPATNAVAQNSLVSWQIAIAAGQTAYLAQVETARLAHPEADIQTFDLAGILADLLTTSALDMFETTDLFTASHQKGTETLTALAGLVVQMAQSQIPVGPAEDLPAKVLENYTAISNTVWEMVGATLADTSTSLPTEPNDGTNGKDLEIPVLSTFRGTEENDTIAFSDDFQTVVGGDGIDTLVMDVSSTDVSVQKTNLFINPDDALALVLATEETSVTLQDMERIAFSDGTLAFDEDGIAGQAYRLYQACFDRQPDAEGLGFWIKQLDAGLVSLQETAGYFLTSEEFATVYGKPSELADINYLALLYANVLDRAPDSEGFDYWREQQENGVTRIDMLVSFSESVENVARVAPAIDDGIWYL